MSDSNSNSSNDSRNSPNFNDKKNDEGNLSTKYQEKQMKKDALQLGSTLQEMMTRFGNLETKLSELDKEQVK